MPLIVKFLLVSVLLISALTLVLSLGRLSIYRKTDETEPAALFGAAILSLIIFGGGIALMVLVPW